MGASDRARSRPARSEHEPSAVPLPADRTAATALPGLPMIVTGVAMVGVAVVGIVMGVAAPAALAVATMLPAAVVDLRERRLPDGWLLTSACVLLVATAVSWAFGAPSTTAAPGATVVGIAAGAIAMAAPLLALHLVSPVAMGFGDVKASLVLGAVLGSVDWRLGLMALTLAAGAGALLGLARRSSTIPFGPFLVMGAVGALLAESLWFGGVLAGGVS